MSINAQATSVKNTAQFLIDQLHLWGIKRIYGVIGDANLHLLDELSKQDQIHYIACKHEGAAALMASAEAKLTGRVGVCLATSGPGMVNLLNGLGDAFADHAGVLAITGQVEMSKIGTATKQYLNQQQMVHPLAIMTQLLAHPDALPELLKEALTRAQLYGEVTHLSISKDQWLQPVKGKSFPYPAYYHQSMITPNKEIMEAVDFIHKAKKPLILIGLGAMEVRAEVLQFAELLPAAVITTMPAKMLFPNDQLLYSGGLGQGGSEASTELIAQSDLILILGATWWPDEYTETQANIIQVDRIPEHIGRGKAVSKGMVGDMKQILPQLITEYRKKPTQHRTNWTETVYRKCANWKNLINEESLRNGSPIPPQSVMRAIADAAEDNAILAIDTGDHSLWFNRNFVCKPDQTILISGRWRTLGFGIPAGIAAKLSQPERPVWVIAGDGAVVQTIMEMHTAVLQKAHINIVILNNDGYIMEKNRMIASGLKTMGSELKQPNFVQIAEACGAKGIRIDQHEQLKNTLSQTASPLSQSILIDIHTAEEMVPHTKL